MPVTSLAAPAKRLLGYVPAYVMLQRIVGADRLRSACIGMLDLQPAERVLDVGCGPAYYLDELPRVDYLGFDTAPRYIEYARRRWAGRGEFRAEPLTAATARTLGKFDAVLLMGVLHHMSDGECEALLEVLAASLSPSGRVISLDTTYRAGQSRIARWMADNDRGEHVRFPEHWTAMASARFDEVDHELLEGVTRIPSSFWVMQMRAPKGAVQSGR